MTITVPCATIAPKSIQSPQSRAKRAPQAIKHSRLAGVLTVQAIRHFHTLEKASVYLSYRVKANQYDRFIIQQTAPNSWTVCRIIAGGAS